MSKSQRKGRLINSRVQRTILFKFICHWMLSIVAVFGISFTLHLMFKSPEESYASILGDMKNRYSLTVFVLFALIPYFLRDLIELTHRVAGPMIRFRNAIQSAARGDKVRPVKFRDGDFWQEVADDFNVLMKRVAELEGYDFAEAADDDAPESDVQDAVETTPSQREPELVAST